MPRYPDLSDAHHGLSSRVYTSLLALAETHAPEVLALNVGDTYRLPPACARTEALPSTALPRLYNYANVQGEPRLLEAIVSDLARRGRPVSRERIQVTAGATSGLDLVCRTLLSAGDEVIILAPFWPLIRGIVSAAGALPVELPCFTRLREPGFDLSAALEGALGPRTVALYVNHPHNPTGSVLRADEIEIIARFVSAHGLWLISDEAYERLHFSAQPPPALWCHEQLHARSVVAHTFSKSFGLAGARVGFVHGPERALSAIAGLQTFATYCAPRPMQLLAAQALESDAGESWLGEARAAYAQAARATGEALGIPAPESGTFVIFDLRPFLRSGETPAQLLARCATRGVVLTPGAATGAAYADYARLCFTALPPDALARALAILRSEFGL
jgi:N-succinyldiaminopimelate aminotransferase